MDTANKPLFDEIVKVSIQLTLDKFLLNLLHLTIYKNAHKHVPVMKYLRREYLI